MAAVRRSAVAATRLWDCVAVAATGRQHMSVESSQHFIPDKDKPRGYTAPVLAPSNLSRSSSSSSSSSVASSSLPYARPYDFLETKATRINHPPCILRGALFPGTAHARRFESPRPAASPAAISPIPARGIAGSSAIGSASGGEPGGIAAAGDGGGEGHAILELKLAQTGEGIAECELLQWFVEEGEEVRAFQRVCQVQSDKATVDITSRFQGRILRTHFMPGDIVKVGETLVDILPPGAGEPAAASAPPPHDTSSQPRPTATDSTTPSTNEHHAALLAVPAVRHLAKTHGINLADVEGTGRDGRVTKEDVLAYVQSRQGVEEEMRMEEHVLEGPEPALDEAGGEGGGGGVRGGGGAKEERGVAAGEEREREMAARVGVAAGLEGMGVSGRAHLDDVDSSDVLLPMRGYRRAMARAMAAALAVPHFTFMDEVTMDAALALRSQLNASSAAAAAAAGAAGAGVPGSGSGSAARAADKAAAAGGASAVRLTHLPILVKALSVALQDFPTLNSTLDDASLQHLRCKRAHNIGIAMATPSGLVVPNVKNCQSKSIPQIAADIARLRRLALLNQLPNEDVTGGTISISNIGSIGGTYATPLVNLPEVAIVALGRVHTVPRFDADGNVLPVSLMNVSWSADHRVIDGATLAAFSSRWKSFIECPANLLLHLM
ncbi:hypothetical protein CLOM_g6213 [Closterium sp. NIES-68]|nr:hypothetical protein CLOM_g6213 [Closterium sp. NIES-68]GJP62071.1 hypothetical protein CLOP_g19172 [Closterium sp. NIES-67]